ncbi:hypothetical protein KSS87_016212, partial [Heliosperma pusillum]
MLLCYCYVTVADISTVSVLDISTVSVAENTIPTSGESSNGNMSSTPTCTQGEDEFIPSLHYSNTPGGSERWIRTVEAEFTPKLCMSCSTVDKGLEFYKIYALACGFDVRKHTNGTAKGGVLLKLIVCNKQGERDMKRRLRLQSANYEVGSSSTTEQKTPKTRQPKKHKLPIVYDENGKVIEDFDEVEVRKIEMSNVWSEIYKTVGLLDSGELKNMKEFSKLLKQFRETVVGAVEKKSKNKEIEDLLGCKAPQEIDILPPHKAKNKGSGKRQMSSKEKVVRKTEKRKRRCGNCKRWVNHNSRTCNLPFVEDLPSDDDERETDDEESFSKRKKNTRPKYSYFTFLCKRMSSITDNNQISPLEEALDKANKKIESLSIEILEALTNVEAAEAREEYMQKELDSLQAQIHFLEAEKDVLEAMELMHAYKNNLRDDFLE